ncbi:MULTISPECIES: bifunctional glycosyltransferase family 2 protein/CDP-glycerol:glycerophosphate glycerophosphotransferase [unclassified Streptomyces]|uniref:bifunctional glycosyltransferase/CDP-glycerol:glycerophosphate glycerophosphotransferase n=1 Tax=unclassified Streptomyces TaxID=2593676 RepID=UPI00278C7689|nr:MULTISPECIES: bifunctional glycosyltransferase family 2 protein/CDP-glycerol:glycerophosphate glycerophosphotransferase [unclassified Streptomyces]
MPRFSIVVPVYRVQGYLRECLDSVVAQEYGDFEVIAVDDRSPDDCGAILDTYASADPRVRPVHLERNVGLGRARNAGLEHAVGDYVLFLDGDDTLTPGALAAMAARLDATADPDLLVFDYTRTYWDDSRRPNSVAHLLAEQGPDVFRLTDRPGLLDLLQVVWNKAYRRAFLTQHGFTFTTGYYEDVPWTYAALITAERIAVADRVCVEYRQRRQGGNILATTSRKHFDVFAQYDHLFTHLDTHPELDPWRNRLFEKMVDHYLTIYTKPDRLPERDKAEFFHEAARHYRTRRPNGYRRPGGGRGHRYALLERDLHPAMRALHEAVRGTRAARRRASNAARVAKRAAMSAHYQAELRRPLDHNLAVFSSYWSRGVTGNPAAIAERLAQLAPHIRHIWLTRPDCAHRIPSGTEHVMVGSHAYWSAMARAKYFVNDVNFADSVVKRAGQIHLQTHHGTPLKTMGLDQRRYPASTHMDFETLLKRCDRWDYGISSNTHSTAVWERAYPSAHTTLETGYPRNDALARAGATEVDRARSELGLTEGVTALLYMPTHREYEGTFVPRLDLTHLAETLGPDTVLLVRGHYFYDSAPQSGQLWSEGRIKDVSAHPQVETLYLAADALITDYSSAMFDYAVLDRPIVIYADDWETYRAVRGTYFDLLHEPPGPVARTQDDLEHLLTEGIWNSPESTSLRAQFRHRFCQFDDGHAAERVVRRVFLDDTTPVPVTPLNQRPVAPAPTRRQCGKTKPDEVPGLEAEGQR